MKKNSVSKDKGVTRKRDLLHFHPIVSVIALVLGILGTLLVTHIFAQTTPQQIYACVKDNGQIRIISQNIGCKDNETALSWNQQGPQGIPGPSGVPGPQGAPGSGGGFGLPFMCAFCRLTHYASTFQGKDFSNAQIVDGNFANADIHGVIFKGAWLNLTDFSNTNLTGADFSNLLYASSPPDHNSFQPSTPGATLYFVGSNLTNANFSNDKIIYGSLFTNANLQNINFTNTTFNGVDFTGAQNMNTANLTNTTWTGVTCPDGTNSNSHGNSCVGHF